MKTIMYTAAALFALLPLAAVAQADNQTDRAKLVGSWVLVSGGGPAAAWTFTTNADGLHVTEREGTETVADFECNLGGRDCDVKVSGHKATISMYYNGPVLVELEAKGDKVVKRRFSILPSGTSMKLEVLPVSGRGSNQEFEFERSEPAERK